MYCMDCMEIMEHIKRMVQMERLVGSIFRSKFENVKIGDRNNCMRK